jgi:hypothetical protein
MMIIGRRKEDLRIRTDQRRTPRRGHVASRQRSLHLREVRRPVAEAEHEAQPEHHADPIRLQRISHVVDRQSPRGVQSGFAETLEVFDLLGQAVNAADRVQRHQR